MLRIWETIVTSYSYASSFDISPQAAETRTHPDAPAWLLDSAIGIPGTKLRLGADALLNLIPGVGTLTSKGMSADLTWEARRPGVPTTALLRMAGSIDVDLVISAIPIVGWVGNVFYRSNLRNMPLLRKHIDRTHPAPHSFQR